jgi:putative sterol carrier protein
MVESRIGEVFSRMPELFNPSAAQGIDAVFQFNITGDGGGNWTARIKDGTCQIQEGDHENPSVSLTVSVDTWLAIANKEMSGMEAFMSGRLKVSGDIMLAQRIEQLFRF